MYGFLMQKYKKVQYMDYEERSDNYSSEEILPVTIEIGISIYIESGYFNMKKCLTLSQVFGR